MQRMEEENLRKISEIKKRYLSGDLATEFDYQTALLDNQEEYDKQRIQAMYRDWETDRKSTRLNSSHSAKSRMPSSA